MLGGRKITLTTALHPLFWGKLHSRLWVIITYYQKEVLKSCSYLCWNFYLKRTNTSLHQSVNIIIPIHERYFYTWNWDDIIKIFQFLCFNNYILRVSIYDSAVTWYLVLLNLIQYPHIVRLNILWLYCCPSTIWFQQQYIIVKS